MGRLIPAGTGLDYYRGVNIAGEDVAPEEAGSGAADPARRRSRATTKKPARCMRADFQKTPTLREPKRRRPSKSSKRKATIGRITSVVRPFVLCATKTILSRTRISICRNSAIPNILAFFFERPVLKDGAVYRDVPSKLLLLRSSKSASGNRASHRNVLHFSEVAGAYSAEQIEQGLWALFGSEIDCGQYLFTSAVNVNARVQCIDSMYCVFRDVVTHQTGDEKDTFYWMWWDMILHTRAFRNSPLNTALATFP